MFIITHRKIFFIFSGILILLSIYGMTAFGFNFGIDFKGGSLEEVKYTETRPDMKTVEGEINKLGIGGFSLRPSGDKNFIVRTKELSDAEKKGLNNALSLNNTFSMENVRTNDIGPVVGNELKNKALYALMIVILGIVLFVTFAFRKVSEPVSSWKYGISTIIALAHDIIIPTGVFVFLGHFLGYEIDVLFVTALLAILGYSVHDTIVVFDRVRENLRHNREIGNKEEFESTVGKSVSQTMGRSINTSLTIFITLLALYILGGESTRNFSLILLVGVIAGTYSSIFIASPLLVTLFKLQKK